MSTLTISIPEDRMQKLAEIAQRFGIAPEELVRASIEELIARPEEDFRRALDYVLDKNAELYRQAGVVRYLSVSEVLEIHSRIMQATSSTLGVHSLAALESAVAQPRMTFGGEELYATLAEKAAALGFSLIQNHPFVDGNKRAGHAALETFLVLNGYEINATVEEQFALILGVAASEIGRETFVEWLRAHIIPLR